MGFSRRRSRPVPPDEYAAAGDSYLGYLKAAFEWNWENREGGSFFPLHLSASFAAAHAATALLHSLPASPYFSQPGALDEEALKRLLIRMRWVMSYMLLRQTDADDNLVRAALDESTAYFSRGQEEHEQALAFVGRLLADDTWESRVDRLGEELTSGLASGPGEVGQLAAFVTEPISTPSGDLIGESLRLLAVNAEFVIPCFEHGVETGLLMMDEIAEKGWEQFARELSE